MPKCILDPCVEDELWDVWHFIAQDDPHAATRVIEAAYGTFKMLAAIPTLASHDNFEVPSSAISVRGAFRVSKITSFFIAALQAAFR